MAPVYDVANTPYGCYGDIHNILPWGSLECYGGFASYKDGALDINFNHSALAVVSGLKFMQVPMVMVFCPGFLDLLQARTSTQTTAKADPH